MTKTDLPTINIEQRKQAPTVTPQALTWDGKYLWMSSRDLGTLLKIDADAWKIVEEFDPPEGVIWAGVSTNDGLRFTIGKGLNDSIVIYSFSPNEGFRSSLHVRTSPGRTSVLMVSIIILASGTWADPSGG